MSITTEQAIQRISENVVDNKRDIFHKNLQRRTGYSDLYGQQFTASGDGGSPATIYISIPRSIGEWLRYDIKLIIEPFITTVSGNGTASSTVKVNNRNLSVSGSNVSPNPHDHGTEAHTHNIVAGIGKVNTDATDFRVTMSGYDVTPYLMAQYDGEWIEGEGIYPGRDPDESNYDILELGSDLTDEGKIAERDAILQPGLKTISVSSAKPFGLKLILYAYYTHVNR